MLKKLKDILNTYTDEELVEMSFWINTADEVSYILVEDWCISLITKDSELKINGYIEQEGNNENN